MRFILLFLFLCFLCMPVAMHAKSKHDALRAKYLEISKQEGKKHLKLSYAFKVKRAAKREFGTQSMPYLRALNNIGVAYLELENPEKAAFWWHKGVAGSKNLESQEINTTKIFLYKNLRVVYMYWLVQKDSADVYASLYLESMQNVNGISETFLNEVCLVAWEMEDEFDLDCADKYYSMARTLRASLFGAFSGELICGIDALIRSDTSAESINYSDFRNVIYSTIDTSLSLIQLNKISELYRDSASSANMWGGPWHLKLMDVALKDQGDTSKYFLRAVQRLGFSFRDTYAERGLSYYCLNSLIKLSKHNNKILAENLIDIYADMTSLFGEVASEEEVKYTYINAFEAFDYPTDSLYFFGNKMLTLSRERQGKSSEHYPLALAAFASALSNLSSKSDTFSYVSELMDTSLVILKTNCGAKSEAYGRMLQEWSSLMIQHAILDSALSTRLAAYEILFPINSDQNNYWLCQGISNIYSYMGKSSKSARWADKANVFSNDIIAKEGKRVFYILWNEMSIHLEFKRWNEAKLSLDEMKNVFSKERNPPTSSIIEMFMAEAEFYAAFADYEKAEALYLDALVQIKAGKEQMYYESVVKIHSELSSLYLESHNYNEAIEHAQETKQYYSTHNIKEFHFGMALENGKIARAKYYLGEIDSAIFYFNSALKVTSGVDFTSKEYQDLRIGLALAMAKTGNLEEAELLMASACAVLLKSMTENLTGLSEAEKQRYNSQLQDELFKYFTLQSEVSKSAPQTNVTAYNFIIQSRGLLLNTSRFLSKAISKSQDTTLLDLVDEIKDLKNKLVKSYAFSSEDSEADIELLQLQIRKKEQQLSFDSPAISDFVAQNNYDFSVVKKCLGKDEAVIQFVTFHKWQDSKTIAETKYSAFIITSALQYPIEIVLDLNEKHTYEQVQSQGITRGANDVNLDIITSENALYQSIWQPMNEYLKGVNVIYLAADGIISKVSFSGIKDEFGRYLSDKYAFHYVLNSKDIIRIKSEEPTKSKKSIALFGGSFFTADLAHDEELTMKGTRSLPNDYKGNIVWNYLENTLAEVERIDSNLTQNDWLTALYIGAESSEYNFKALSGSNSPKVIHVATHGFYFPPQNATGTLPQGAIESANTAMNRTGLIFSGANDSWLGKPVSDGREDGVLTSSEFANLDFETSDLIVLSACETGVGDILNGEGVYGLPRAIRQAGISKMLLSLWPVPDKETAEMMSYFYENLGSSMDYYSAFLTAQAKMRIIYPDQPSLWAGFVLIE